MKNLNLVLWIIVFGFLSACAPVWVKDENNPVTSEDTPVTNTPTVDRNKYEIGEQAMVESVEPIFLESFPLQVHVHIKGNLRDGCTGIYRTDSIRENNTFNVRILTIREKDVACTQALVPFEINVPLDVSGLPAGTYQVLVYDVTAEFTFTQDNIIRESGDGS